MKHLNLLDIVWLGCVVLFPLAARNIWNDWVTSPDLYSGIALIGNIIAYARIIYLAIMIVVEDMLPHWRNKNE